TNFLGYNTGEAGFAGAGARGDKWVGDLMVECDADVSQAAGELVLELSKGVDRFQARFALASGDCTLVRIGPRGEEQLATQKTRLVKPGTYRLRFANFDNRLTVWVDGVVVPFGKEKVGFDYDPPADTGPHANDLEPVNIGAKGGAVAVSKLVVWR